MTTPAINRNVILTAPCTWTKKITTPGGSSSSSTSLYSNPKWFWDREIRPASGSTAIDPITGFRPCRAWSHSGYVYKRERGSAWWETHSGPNLVRYTFDNGGYWNINSVPAVPGVPNSVVNRAEVQALNKLKGQDVHLGAFIGEFNKTEAMIANRISRIAGGVSRWRARNSKQNWNRVKKYMRAGCGRKYLRLVPASWLELVYGWSPLLSDIWGGINHLQKGSRDPLISVKGYYKDEDLVKQNVAGLYGSSCRLDYKVSFECWVRLYYRLNSPGLAEVSSLGLLNPAEVAWELTPYSYVVDWILPIGPWLSSLTADAGFSFIGGSRSKKTTMENGEIGQFNWGDAGGTKHGGDLPSMTGEGYVFDRFCYSSSPVPGIYVKNPLSAIHVANAIALLLTAFRG